MRAGDITARVVSAADSRENVEEIRGASMVFWMVMWVRKVFGFRVTQEGIRGGLGCGKLGHQS